MAIPFKAGNPEASAFNVPAGEYKLRVIEATQDTSKTGNDMIKLKLRVVKKDGTDGPALFDYLVFTEKAFYKVDQFLKACDKHPGEGEQSELDADEMIGWECEASLKIETYNGKESNKIEAYLFDDDGF